MSGDGLQKKKTEGGKNYVTEEESSLQSLINMDRREKKGRRDLLPQLSSNEVFLALARIPIGIV